jgi:acetyltransferase-like isoleucine patch superfamily enzyme
MANARYKSVSKALEDADKTWIDKYCELVVGRKSLVELIKYEFITSALGGFPGGAGIYLRSRFYRTLFKKYEKNIIIGKNVYLSQPGKISLGSNVVIGISTHLDVKGGAEAEVKLQDKVSIGHGTIIRSRLDAKINIGYNTAIGDYTHISAGSNVDIGDNVLGAPNLNISAGSHRYDRTDIPIRNQPGFSLGVVIEDNVWLGSSVQVLDGIRIGRDSIIGSGSVVTRDIPPWSIAFGVPARVVENRRDTIAKLKFTNH